MLQLALEGLILLETVGDDGLTLGGRQHVAAESHQSAGRDLELEQSAVPTRFHAQKGALAAGRDLDRGTYESLGNFDGEVLDRLATLAADDLVKHLRLADLKLEALARDAARRVRTR